MIAISPALRSLAETIEDMYHFLTAAVWHVLEVTPPDEKDPLFDQILSSSEDVDFLYSEASGVGFAPGLLELLQLGSAEHVLDFLKQTPALDADSIERFVNYILVLEKVGSKPFAYRQPDRSDGTKAPI